MKNKKQIFDIQTHLIKSTIFSLIFRLKVSSSRRLLAFISASGRRLTTKFEVSFCVKWVYTYILGLLSTIHMHPTSCILNSTVFPYLPQYSLRECEAYMQTNKHADLDSSSFRHGVRKAVRLPNIYPYLVKSFLIVPHDIYQIPTSSKIVDMKAKRWFYPSDTETMCRILFSVFFILSANYERLTTRENIFCYL